MPEQTQQQIASGDAIADFRTQYNDALTSTGHPEHERRARELTALYEKKYAAEPTPAFDPVQGQERPETDLDKAMLDALVPLMPDQYEVGPTDNFGLNVDQEQYGWDAELERDSRQAFARASLNGAEARTLATAYYESIQPKFDPEQQARAATEALQQEYGRENVDNVLSATNRMLRDYAPPAMLEKIRSTGLGNNARFVNAAVRFAKRKGYF